ncbi:hypothetical protein PZE06_20530 [Robertmurraya sp. DFI.2.37]|uniref:hypothetical protein n=1 Tax=Robertmurraya sp. DFI.2.37 TaxID=3031819 RepID=UPI0012493923|nr:hypothetical protein [Robertmurraya sp. DFI.2.37]MDF1510524.1 hypothetical protein [Robertmurraya sp. DFI.2.37]
MDDATYQELMNKIGNIILQNKQLRRANLKKDKTIRYLKRVIKKQKYEAAKERKPHYRNGQKRGRTRNG